MNFRALVRTWVKIEKETDFCAQKSVASFCTNGDSHRRENCIYWTGISTMVLSPYNGFESLRWFWVPGFESLQWFWVPTMVLSPWFWVPGCGSTPVREKMQVKLMLAFFYCWWSTPVRKKMQMKHMPAFFRFYIVVEIYFVLYIAW